MTQEEKARKYDEALERAKKVNICEADDREPGTSICEYIFPELKENEDEKIRKAIHIYLDWLNGRKDYQPKGDYTIMDMIAWLEKQGEIDKASYDIAEKEKYDFVSGQFIECRKSFNEFKEDNSYWLEYVGNDTYIGRSDNILNKKFHITPRQLYRLFTQEHCYKEDNANEETNAPFSLMKIFDLRTLYKRLNELKAQKGEQL